jgi:transposase
MKQQTIPEETVTRISRHLTTLKLTAMRNAKAMQWVCRTVTMKNSFQLKFTYALWTAKIVGQVIYKRFGMKLSKASVCRLLGQLGLTPQRLIWRAYQQKPEAVQQWLEKE